jgi:predicted small lipoprotein YifL
VSCSFRPALRLAATGALLLALGLTLSACGRRGPPDAPPGVVSGPQGTYELDEQGRPIAPAGQKKRLPIDVLLD